MQKAGDALLLSASDLIGHLNCRHLTELDLAVALGALEKPDAWDPQRQLLLERGLRHEREYVESLKSDGLPITVIEGVGVDDEAIARTRAAMEGGAEIIVQGAFRSGAWIGRTDVLRRIDSLDSPSGLGPWSYEVIDTKLARETKSGTVLQLCLYAELLADAQGARPWNGYVVAPHSGYEPQAYRMDDYGAYFRRVRLSLAEAVNDRGKEETYPDPKAHCDICRWKDRCDRRRREDDHLSLVAGASTLQIEELQRRGIETVAALAAMPLPLAFKPSRDAAQSYERIREQARMQVEGRETGRLVYELLPVNPGFGLALLPEPSPGDVFFDLEGDPFVGEGGLEYLFGYAYSQPDGSLAYVGDWAFSREEEKSAFERFIDFVIARLEARPDLHIYHYAPYEPAALKRLMGRYASRGDELDRLLRSKRFVDLFSVVRNGLRASVESYSIKKLEPLYNFARATLLPEANRALGKLQARLELGDLESVDEADRGVVAGYNRDDCLSALGLHDWLEGRRTSLIDKGAAVPRPVIPDGEPSERLSDRQRRVNALVARLTDGVPADANERTAELQARWLLAYSLDWHRHEQKALWWEYYRLSDLTADELIDERAALSGLTFVEAVGGTARAPIHRYSFPPQETELRGEEKLHNVGGAKFGEVHAISLETLRIDIKKRSDTAGVHPEAVFAHKVIGAEVLANSLMRIGEHVAKHGMPGDGPYLAARDLLMRLPPRIGGQPIQTPGETPLKSALRLAPSISEGIFPIQGPPGSGKTHIGARMICALVAAGRTAGVTANSHKVIRNLLDEVLKAAEEMAVDVRCIQKVSEKPSEMEVDQPRLRFTKSNETLLAAIGDDCNVAGGTAWVWASPDAANAADVLFIDEAAQMSLANVLAVSQAARALCCWAIRSSSNSPCRAATRKGPMFPRCITFFKTPRRSRPTAACS
jgi:predicted RecB family nuclease